MVDHGLARGDEATVSLHTLASMSAWFAAVKKLGFNTELDRYDWFWHCFLSLV